MVNSVQKTIDSLIVKFKNAFRPQKHPESTPITTVVMTSTITTTTTTTAVVTPNHVPCPEGDAIAISTISKWQRILGRSKEEIPFSAVSMANEQKPSKSPPLKPAELWKIDQTLMLHGRYKLNEEFANKYHLKQLLGEGSFGFVWVADRISDHEEVPSMGRGC